MTEQHPPGQQNYPRQQWGQSVPAAQHLSSGAIPQFQQQTPHPQSQQQFQPQQFQPQTQQQPVPQAQQQPVPQTRQQYQPQSQLPSQQAAMQPIPQLLQPSFQPQTSPQFQAQSAQQPQQSTGFGEQSQYPMTSTGVGAQQGTTGLQSVAQPQSLASQTTDYQGQFGQSEMQSVQGAQTLGQPSASVQPQWQTVSQAGQSQQYQQGQGSPNVDVIETPESISVFVDLPGCEEENISIQADGRNLTILAERREEHEEGETVFQRERPTTVKRTVTLPAGADIEMAEATYENGVAKITLPKQEGEKQKQIGFQ